MRTIIQIPDQFAKALAEICQRDKISRAEAIRRAIVLYTAHQTRCKDKGLSVFGLWKSRAISSIDYVDSLRNEWKKR